MSYYIQPGRMTVMISALLAFLVVGTPDATAGFDLLQLAEVMANTETADGLNIGTRFGPDPTSPLSYSAYVNLANGTFSYSLVAGSTYLGSPITQQTTGAYDSTTGAWDLTSAGTGNGQSWSGTGTAMVTGDPDLALHLSWTDPKTMFTTAVGIHGSFFFDPDTGDFISSALVTVNVVRPDDFGTIVSSSSAGAIIDSGKTDPTYLNIIANYLQTSFNLDGGPGLAVAINEQPIGLNGGPTGFTQVIEAVPEPSSLTMITTSTLILFGIWSRHRTRRDAGSGSERGEGR